MIREWCHDVIHSAGGFLDYAKREMEPRSYQAAAEWVIRCLANPDCEGAWDVLEEILIRRRRRVSEEWHKLNGIINTCEMNCTRGSKHLYEKREQLGEEMKRHGLDRS